MHELTVAMAILEIADREVVKSGGHKVCELTLKVGELSGVDAEALEFALSMATRKTLFESANIRIIRSEGDELRFLSMEVED